MTNWRACWARAACRERISSASASKKPSECCGTGSSACRNPARLDEADATEQVRLWLGGRCARQLNGKLRALADLALRPDGPVVRLDDRLGNRQPQPRAARVHGFQHAAAAGSRLLLRIAAARARLVRAIEALEDMRQVFRPDALAVINHHHLRHIG